MRGVSTRVTEMAGENVMHTISEGSDPYVVHVRLGSTSRRTACSLETHRVVSALFCPNTFYEIEFIQKEIRWNGKANQGNGKNCPVIQTPNYLNDTYGCRNNPEFCKQEYTPAGGAFALWGATFHFDASGQVTFNGTPAGILLLSPGRL
jgi:hypothetical protein